MEEAATDDFFSLVAELADPLPEDSDEDEDEEEEDDDEDEVLVVLSEEDPFDSLAPASFPAATVLEPFRLSVR